MKIDFSAGKEKYKKNERLINLIAAFSLVAQFIAVLVTGLTTEKRSKATKVIMILSSIGGAVGSFFLYKELLAPAISKKLADYTLGDKDDSFDFDDEFNSYADSVGEPDLNWYSDEEEDQNFSPEDILNNVKED